MKANELRIGNYVLDSEGGQVTEVMPSDFSITVCTYLEPIPLTEEWLIKFGFYYNKSFEHYQLVYDNGSVLIIEKSIRAWIWKFNKVQSIKLQHVHQLQNLYFALTGEELKLNQDE